METTIKKLTNEEKRKRQHEIIQQWKKDVDEANADFEAWSKTPEAERIRKELKEENEKQKFR